MVLHFNLHFLTTSDTGHLFICLLDICISLLLKMEINRKMRISFGELYLVAAFLECVYTGH